MMKTKCSRKLMHFLDQNAINADLTNKKMCRLLFKRHVKKPDKRKRKSLVLKLQKNVFTVPYLLWRIRKKQRITAYSNFVTFQLRQILIEQKTLKCVSKLTDLSNFCNNADLQFEWIFNDRKWLIQHKQGISRTW